MNTPRRPKSHPEFGLRFAAAPGGRVSFSPLSSTRKRARSGTLVLVRMVVPADGPVRVDVGVRLVSVDPLTGSESPRHRFLR